MHLKQIDIIRLFTDGVVESVSKTNNVYGDRRLINLIKKHHHLPAKKIIQKIEDDLQKFEEKSEQHDDMTMAAIRKKEPIEDCIHNNKKKTKEIYKFLIFLLLFSVLVHRPVQAQTDDEGGEVIIEVAMESA